MSNEPDRRPVAGRSDETEAAGGLWQGLAAALLLTLVWLGLTLNSGLTYHFFPALIAATPAVIAGLVGATLRLAAGLGRSLAGLALVTAAWLFLEAVDQTPTATFIDAQPGGVRLEVAVLALLGALAGPLLARRSSV